MDQLDSERKETGAVNQVSQWSQSSCLCVKGCFYQPSDQSGIIYGKRWPGGVNALGIGLQKHIPVQIGPYDVPYPP